MLKINERGMKQAISTLIHSSPHYRSGIGLECWTGVLEWSAGMECWNGVLEGGITGME